MLLIAIPVTYSLIVSVTFHPLLLPIGENDRLRGDLSKGREGQRCNDATLALHQDTAIVVEDSQRRFEDLKADDQDWATIQKKGGKRKAINVNLGESDTRQVLSLPSSPVHA